jgi:signal peptidase I
MEPLENETAGQPASEAPEPPGENRGTKSGHRESVWETVRSLLVVLVGVFCIRTFIAEATVIPTGSMEQTILIGDHVFLNKLLYGPRFPYTSLRIPPLRSVHRQDIVAFRYPRNPSVMFVKRVIAVGGDVLKIEDRKVLVNGRPLKEPYAQFQYVSTLPLRDNFPPPVDVLDTLRLGAGFVVVAGNAQFHPGRWFARAPGISVLHGRQPGQLLGQQVLGIRSGRERGGRAALRLLVLRCSQS